MLVYVSAFVSPHTMPFGVALTHHYDRVVFINTMTLTQERKQMGYDITDTRVEIRQYSEEPELCRQLIDEARDVILAGTAFHLIASRIQKGKRVFIAHERIFKKGILKLLDPRTWKIARFCRSVRSKPVYLLAIGENAAKDFRFLGFEKKKIFRFGYFPALSAYSQEQLQKPEGKCRVLWVGRFVDFKRPLMAVKAFKGLEDTFTLTMAGNGALWEETKAYARKKGIAVTFLGNLSAKEVEEQMLQSHILLSTSHKGEGWGAVINEGMNRGCAVVCSKQIGCAGSLATKENAVLYKTGSIRDLRKALKEAAQRQAELGQAGYETVCNHFNAEVAAQRFAKLAENRNPDWESGVCARIF